MDQHTVHPPPPSQTTRPPARRSSTDRLVGGVSTAAAQYLGVSLTVARIIFVVAALVGGLGLVLYAVLWLFVPDDHERVLIQGYAASSGESIVSALLSGLASLSLSAWITRDGPSWLASILVTVGVFVLSRRAQAQDDARTVPPSPPGGSGPPVPPAPASAPPTPGGPVRAMPLLPLTTPPAGVDPQSTGVQSTGAQATGVLPLLAERGPVFPRATPGPRSPERLAPPSPAKPPKPAAFLGPLTVSIAVALAGSLSVLHAIGAIDIRPSDALITVLAVVGLGLLVSTWFGRARGLILVGLLLVPAVALSAVVDRVDLRGGTGDRSWAPTTAAELQERYRLGAGSLQLDLTELDTSTIDPDHPVLSTELSVGAGRVQLIVPQTWSLEASSDVEVGTVWSYSGGIVVQEGESLDRLGGGEVRYDLADTTDWYFPDGERVPNDQGDDSGRRTIEVTGDEGAPALDIDIDVTAGVVEVLRVEA